MKAVQFDLSLPKYTLSKTMGKFRSSIYYNSLFSCLSLTEQATPQLPTDEWVKISVKYGGICGSDLNLIFLKDSPATSPFVSFPFTIGHELVGKISEVGSNVDQLSIGERVIIDPILSCQQRGLSPLCKSCQDGQFNLCQQMDQGYLSPGLLTGTCKDTSGSWSPTVLAHKSQVIKLPDDVNDENGVLIEPFSCALHTVLKNPPKSDDTIFIIGSGVIGLCVVAAIRAINRQSKIIVLAKHTFQADMAYKFGANHVITLSRKNRYIDNTAQSMNAKVLYPIFGKPVVHGGADLVYDCVGNKQSLEDSLRFAKKGGKIALLGLTSHVENVDLTMLWLNEIEIKGSFAYGTEKYKGKNQRTMEMALHFIQNGDVNLAPLITHKFSLEQYREAISTASSKKSTNSLKVVFEP